MGIAEIIAERQRLNTMPDVGMQPDMPQQFPVAPIPNIQQPAPQNDDRMKILDSIVSTSKTQEEAMGKYHMLMAQKAMQMGLTDDANQLVKMSKMYGGGDKEGSPYGASATFKDFLAATSDVHKFDVTNRDGYNKAINWAGTTEGKKAYSDWLSSNQRYKRQFVGMAEEPGYGVTFDSEKGFETIPIPRGNVIGPRNAPVMSNVGMGDIKFGTQLGTLIDDIEDLYEKSKKGKLGQSEFVGALDNIRGKAGVYIPSLTTPNEQSFRVLLEALTNIKGKEQAGSAWSQAEMDRVFAELPRAFKGEVAFEAALKNTRRNVMRKLDAVHSSESERGAWMPNKGKKKEEPKQPTGGKVGRFTVTVED